MGQDTAHCPSSFKASVTNQVPKHVAVTSPRAAVTTRRCRELTCRERAFGNWRWGRSVGHTGGGGGVGNGAHTGDTTLRRRERGGVGTHPEEA